MTHKIVFTASFYHACGAQLLCLLGVSHHGAIKWWLPLRNLHLPIQLTGEMKKETDLERQKGSG
jgi:hypothetical protein